MSYINRIKGLADNDVAVLKVKDAEYGGSWLKRGGIGAFMMLARKWDRLETAVDKPFFQADVPEQPTFRVERFDIIERALKDKREEGVLDDIADMRRYLLLIEGEIRERMTQDGGLKKGLSTAESIRHTS